MLDAENESRIRIGSGLPRSANNADARVVEADLFGEGEWF